MKSYRLVHIEANWHGIVHLSMLAIAILLGGVSRAATNIPASCVSTAPASGLRYNYAELNGLICGSMNATQASSTAWFEWGTDTNYANVTAVRTVPQSYFNVGVVVPISNLTFNTTYHYRLVVTNAAGKFLGNDLSFASNHLIGLSTYPVIGATGPTSARSLAKYRQWF